MSEIKDRVETSLNEIILEAIEKYMGDWDEAITEARTKILSNPHIAQGLEAIEKGFNAKVDREAEWPPLYYERTGHSRPAGEVRTQFIEEGWVKEIKA